MRLAERARRPADDGIVPLINIVFLLLIFFLIVGTIAPKPDISVAYPETEKSPVTRAPADALYVSSGGYISYRGAALDIDSLAAAVTAVPRDDADGPLPVVVDRALPAPELAPVLGALAGAGVESVRLITLRAGNARSGDTGSGS
ncbi:biopolymer transporter ExbD [Microbaculum marinum]|uniref:Biopolymer transporter ExbD n=1 Tax=Microbaculum marinum TaxID=1764581 RepID=A0AAW9RYC8_9HYPH